MDEAAVVVDSLVKRFTAKTAVAGLSFAVAAGEILRAPRTQRGRQDHHVAGAGRDLDAHRRARAGRRDRRGGRSAGGPPPARLPHQHDRALPPADRTRAARLFRAPLRLAAGRRRRARGRAGPRAGPRALLRTPLRGALHRRASAPLDRPRHVARSGGPDPGRADRRPRRARLPLPARVRARRARSRQGGGVLHALPRRGRAALRPDRSSARRAALAEGRRPTCARRPAAPPAWRRPSCAWSRPPTARPKARRSRRREAARGDAGRRGSCARRCAIGARWR